MAAVKLDLCYTDPRLVALYDHDNPRGADADFYVRLACGLGARRILDLGCGTGLLTRELAVDGREVIGVDPSAAMLAVARAQVNAERVRWVEGDAHALSIPENTALDLVLMTGNVAQVFLDDAEWDETHRAIAAALRPGGHLAFECRNPDDQAWTRWTREATFERIDSPYGPLECWLEVVGVEPGRVRFQGHNVFLETGEDVIAGSELRFRTLAEQRACLAAAGFAVEQVYGDWGCGPVTSASRVFVFIARRIE